MRIVKVRDLAVLRAVPNRVLGLIEQHGIFHLLDCTSVDPAVGYLSICQMMTLDWNAPECAGWLPYS